MGSALISLVSLALPLLKPLATTLITHVEALFGSKTGPTKLGAVISALKPVVDELVKAGVLPSKLDDSTLTAIIETIVADLNGKSALQGAATSPIATLTPGTTLKIASGILTITQ